MRHSLGYPELDDERAMLRRFRSDTPLETISPVTTPDEMVALVAAVRRIHISVAVEGYLLSLVRATRAHEKIEVGASPRASLALARAAQAYAAVRGRTFVRPDDVRGLAGAVLSHRIIATAQADLLGQTTPELIDEVVRGVPVPVEAESAV
jgi:MoxR-like ATPase